MIFDIYVVNGNQLLQAVKLPKMREQFREKMSNNGVVTDTH